MKSKKVTGTPAITGEAGVAKISATKKSKSKKTNSGLGWGYALGGVAIVVALLNPEVFVLPGHGRG